MRFRDIVALILLIAVALGGNILRDQTPSPNGESPRRPAPHVYERAPDGTPSRIPWDAETRDWLSDAPARRPAVPADWLVPERQSFVDLPRQRTSGTGTAFAVGPGKWLSARHVTDGCDEIGLQTAPRKGIRVIDIENHPNADVALLTTRNGPAPFQLGAQTERGDDGYMVGFPKGRPGAVHGRKIGTTTLSERGRYRTRERADVWSERSRVPANFGSLGGLSGGPAFTSDGRLVGVVLAEEPRRGRIITAEPATLRSLIGGSTGGTAHPLDPDGYPRTVREFLTTLRVAKVLCRVR